MLSNSWRWSKTRQMVHVWVERFRDWSGRYFRRLTKFNIPVLDIILCIWRKQHRAVYYTSQKQSETITVSHFQIQFICLSQPPGYTRLLCNQWPDKEVLKHDYGPQHDPKGTKKYSKSWKGEALSNRSNSPNIGPRTIICSDPLHRSYMTSTSNVMKKLKVNEFKNCPKRWSLFPTQYPTSAQDIGKRM